MERAKALGLTRDERIDLAQYLLRRDITSWTQLDEDQVLRLLDAIEGFELIVHLLSSRPGRVRSQPSVTTTTEE